MSTSSNHAQFFSYLNQFYNLSESSKTAINSIAGFEKFSKGTLLASEGKICNHLYFLIKGAVRGYHMKDGKDLSYWFGFENTFITTYIQRLNVWAD